MVLSRSMPMSLHAMTKPGVEGDYRTEVEELIESIQKLKIYGAYNNVYSHNHGRSPYPTLEMKQKTYDENTASCFNTDVENIN